MDLSTFAKVTLGAVCLSVAVLAAQDGPRTNGANLPVRTDANGYLIVAEQTYTAPDGPRRVLANALVRTDANGYLIVTNPVAFGGGTFAPIGAQYWVAAAHADLTAEVDLSALSTGLVLNTGGTPSQYAGSSCTNQFVRSLDVSAAATCAAVVLGTDTTGTLDHGTALTGLSDDDHTQYLLASGTRALSGNWDAGSFAIRAQILESDIVTGTAPLTIASTTVVTNLNVDALDGISSAGFLRVDGSIALTADWDAGSFEIRAQTLESDVATGTAPLTIASTTLVANLNADLLDGVSIAGIAQVSGTPVDDQLAVWTGAGAVEGDSNFVWNGSRLLVQTAGAHRFETGVVGDVTVVIRNTQAGTGAFSNLRIGNDESASALQFLVTSSTFTAGNETPQNGGQLEVNRVGGLSLAATNAAGDIRVYVGGVNESARFDSSQNVAIGTAVVPSTGTFGVVFGDGTALASMGTNTAGLYANDVSGTVEIFAIDEADNATQLSPHNFSLFAPDPNELFPWSYYSANPYLGIEINVDIAKLARLVEQLTGEQIIYTRALPVITRLQWLEEQQRHETSARVEYEAWEERQSAFKSAPNDLVFDELPPDLPVVKLPPAWLLSRLEDLGYWDDAAFATAQAQVRRWKNARSGRR